MYNLCYKMAVLLQDNPNRFVLFPIKHDNLWQFYKKAEGSFWTAEEIDMNDDPTVCSKPSSRIPGVGEEPGSIHGGNLPERKDQAESFDIHADF
jgi:hypothetical protein